MHILLAIKTIVSLISPETPTITRHKGTKQTLNIKQIIEQGLNKLQKKIQNIKIQIINGYFDTKTCLPPIFSSFGQDTM
jgi:hypothetical protein